MLHCPAGPGLDMPMLLDVSGFFLRREGLHGNYICSSIPPLVGYVCTSGATLCDCLLAASYNFTRDFYVCMIWK